MTNPPNNTPETHGDLTADDLLLTTSPRHRSHSTHSTETAPPSDGQPTLLVRPSHTRPKKKHPILKVLLILLLCLVGIVAVAIGTVLVLQHRGQQALLPDTSVTITAPETVEKNEDIEVTDNGRVVKYKDATYVFNENRTNILCLGIDQSSLGLQNGVVGTGGQADTVILLSLDTVTGAIDALPISRDTVTDIDLFAEDGSFVGTERMQLCLSYAYGDGREQSCDTTVRAVSRLLYGIPINTYFAIDLESIATLNDAIGGVELALLNNFRRTDGTTRYAGEFITLYGSEALNYVRARDVEQLASNNDRMTRQKQYLTAFAEKAIRSTKEDLQVPLNLYNTVSDNSITSLTPSKITFLTTALVRHNRALQFHSVKGDVVKGDDGYAEFHIDETALYEQVLDIFYTKE